MSLDGQPPIVGGIPWLKGEERALGVQALASKILCSRHNQALSSLDVLAERFFVSIREDQKALNVEAAPGRETDAFTLLSGQLLERWLLKTFWGALKSRSIGRDGVAIEKFRHTIDESVLADILWRGAAWPDGWGFYSYKHDVDPKGTPDSVEIDSWSDDDRGLLGGVVRVGAIHLFLALGNPAGPAILYRPSGISVARKGSRGEKVVAIYWPDLGHPVVSYTRLE